MREIDRLTTSQYALPSLTLMENAAIATVRLTTALLNGDVIGKPILCLCGKGNNGGDGAAAARLLAIAGARVDVVLMGKIEETKGDARENFRRLQNVRDEAVAHDIEASGAIGLFECESEKGWEQLLAGVLAAPYEAIVDALFGTGLTRPVEGIHQEAVRYINRVRRQRDEPQTPETAIISIDLPSGLNADSEEPSGETVRADATVTMTSPKRANVLPPACHYNGQLIVAEIGSPENLASKAGSQLFLTEAADARRWLMKTRYANGSYKNVHGHALIIAGSRGYTGAAALCGNAAMRAGAGLVTVATPLSAQPIVASQVMPEVMTMALAETDRGAVSDDASAYLRKFSEKADVIAIGPGLSAEDDRTRAFVRTQVEERRAPVVLDADALNCLAPWAPSLRGSAELPLVLTPHPGEMLRLLGTSDKKILQDPVKCARDFAVGQALILVLKGARTIVAAPDGRVAVNPTGNPGLGTAGSGDTLTGVITGFLAQARGVLNDKMDAFETVAAAVYVSGLAGDLAAKQIGMRAMVASDIREHLGAAFRLLDPQGEAPTNS
jgi:NAD(P)H-hydrate epimerase